MGVNAEFVASVRGQEMVLYPGLLDLAHRECGLRGIETEIVQIPTEANGERAIVFAKVKTEAGTFTAIGDASPGNVGRMIVPHILRMAETRAKARALRDATNVKGEVADDMPADALQEGRGGAPAGSGESGKPNGNAGRQTRAQEVGRGAAKNAPKPDPNKARKSQVDRLRGLAKEARGDNGVERLETRIGKPLADLTRDEANEWIDKLSPVEA